MKSSVKVPRGDDRIVLQQLKQLAESIKGDSLLFPSDDYSTHFMDQYFYELEAYYILPVKETQKKGDISQLMSKSVQSQLASKAGLCTPKEWAFDLRENIILSEDITYPCYCKAVSSIEGFKTDQGKYDSKNELLEHLIAVQKVKDSRTFLVQQFLDIADEYIILGACTKKEVIIIGIVNKIECTSYTSGLVVLGELQPIEKVEGFADILPKIISFLESTNYVGLFDLEFIRANGKLYFNELNVRASGLGYCMKKAGINLPGFYVQSIVSDEPDYSLINNVNYGRVFLKEKNAMTDYYEKKRSLLNIIYLLIRAKDWIIVEKADPKPGKLYYWYCFKKIIRIVVRQLIRGDD